MSNKGFKIDKHLQFRPQGGNPTDTAAGDVFFDGTDLKFNNGTSINALGFALNNNQDRNLKLIEGGTWSVNEPLPSVIGNGIINDTGLSNMNASNYYAYYQFTASDSVLTNISSAAFSSISAGTSALRCQIYSRDAVNNKPQTLLYTSSNTVASSSLQTWTGDNVNYTGASFSFSGVSLTPGTIYMAVFTFSSYTSGSVRVSGDQLANTTYGNVGQGAFANGTDVIDLELTISYAPYKQLAWTSDAYIQVPGFLKTRNTIQQSLSPLSIPDGSVAYVSLNRLTDSVTNLPITIAAIDAVDENDKNITIIARGLSDGILMGTGSVKLKSGESAATDGTIDSADDVQDQLTRALDDSPYGYMSSNVFSKDRLALVGTAYGTITASTKSLNITGTNAVISSTLQDPEFENSMHDLDEAQVVAIWETSGIDTSATYELTRNGGVNYQTVTMERVGTTGVFVGRHLFTTESPAISFLSTPAGSGVGVGLNDDTSGSGQQWFAKKFTVTSTRVMTAIEFDIQKDGTPAGQVWVEIVRDNAGVPSTSSSDVLGISNQIDTVSLPANWDTLITSFTLPNIVLPAGTYHFVVKADSVYKTAYTASGGTNQIRFDAGFSGDSTGYNRWNGTTWNSFSIVVQFDLKGYPLDLRLKITPSAGSKKLQAFAVLYDVYAGSISGVTDDIKELVEGNFLGSTDSTIDKSAPGRGIFLRRPDGTLREIAIDDSDNIVVYSV